jgi:hypothetical protein
MFQPWNNAIRMLAGGWALQPKYSGEVFEDTDPIHVGIHNRSYFSAIMLVCLLFALLLIAT